MTRYYEFLLHGTKECSCLFRTASKEEGSSWLSKQVKETELCVQMTFLVMLKCLGYRLRKVYIVSVWYVIDAFTESLL